MERRRLGETGLEVPTIGLGTWQVLDVRGREEASRHEVVRAALEAGANLFDSSPMYGEAERILGDALRRHGRDRAIVATKVWTSNDSEAERQISASLGYFGGRVELYQVHNLVAVQRRLDTLHRLEDEGKVSAVGATHYSRAAFSDLMSVMRSGRVDFVQVPYNAAETTVRYKAPIFLDDALHGAANIPTIGNRSYAMTFELRTGGSFEGGTLVAEGSAAHVFFDPKTDDVQPRPEWFLPAVAELEGRPEGSFIPEGA